MQMRISHSRLYVILLYLIFFNEWFSNMPDISDLYAGIKNVILIIIAVLLLCNVLWDHYSKSEILLFFGLSCITLYSYRRSYVIWMFYLVNLVFMAGKIAPDKLIEDIVRIMKVILAANLVIFAVRFLLFYDSLAITTSRDMLRFDLNFSSGGAASRYLVLYVMAEVIDSKGKIARTRRLFHYFLAIAFFYFTRSEAAFFVFIIYLLIFLKNRIWMQKVIDLGTMFSLPVYTIFTIAAVRFYPSDFFLFFDKLMTGRIALEQRTLLHYEISTWGQFVELPRYVRNADGQFVFLCLDNTIMSFICNYGWIYLIPILIFPFVFRRYLNYYEKIAWCIYSVFFLMIDGGISPFCIFPFLLTASEAADKRGRTRKTKIFNKGEKERWVIRY